MDGIQINTGTGPIVAAELIGTAALQRVKLAIGAVDTDSGDISVSNPMPITGTGLVIASVTTGTMNVVNVLSAANVTIASIATGTMNVINVLSASGVTIASVATGTFSMSGTGNVTIAGTAAVTAANVTVASVTTGTMNVVNVLTGNMVVVTTARGVAGGIVVTGHASQFQGYVLATTSAGGGVIVVTSGAFTLYITDVLISVSGPMTAGIYSETTGPLALGYFAANGGMALPLMQPYICTSAQSLRVICGSSGSCAVSVVGFTVT